MMITMQAMMMTIVLITLPSHSMVNTKCWPGPVLTSMCGVDFLSKSPGFTIALKKSSRFIRALIIQVRMLCFCVD